VTETKNTAETRKHIAQVGKLLHVIVKELLDRADVHDDSKLGPVEAAMFERVTHRLATTTYGTPEYAACLEDMKADALPHHYAHNRHHPEHHKNGIEDMTLIDLVEMLADWKAATMRHNDGDLAKSLEHNETRFGIPPTLAKILGNTARELGWA